MKRIRFYDSVNLKWIDIDEKGIIRNANTWNEDLEGCALFWYAGLRKGDTVYFQGKNGNSQELPGRVESIETMEQEVTS